MGPETKQKKNWTITSWVTYLQSVYYIWPELELELELNPIKILELELELNPKNFGIRIGIKSKKLTDLELELILFFSEWLKVCVIRWSGIYYFFWIDSWVANQSWFIHESILSEKSWLFNSRIIYNKNSNQLSLSVSPTN